MDGNEWGATLPEPGPTWSMQTTKTARVIDHSPIPEGARTDGGRSPQAVNFNVPGPRSPNGLGFQMPMRAMSTSTSTYGHLGSTRSISNITAAKSKSEDVLVGPSSSTRQGAVGNQRMLSEIVAVRCTQVQIEVEIRKLSALLNALRNHLASGFDGLSRDVTQLRSDLGISTKPLTDCKPSQNATPKCAQDQLLERANDSQHGNVSVNVQRPPTGLIDIDRIPSEAKKETPKSLNVLVPITTLLPSPPPEQPKPVTDSIVTLPEPEQALPLPSELANNGIGATVQDITPLRRVNFAPDASDEIVQISNVSVERKMSIGSRVSNKTSGMVASLSFRAAKTSTSKSDDATNTQEFKPAMTWVRGSASPSAPTWAQTDSLDSEPDRMNSHQSVESAPTDESVATALTEITNSVCSLGSSSIRGISLPLSWPSVLSIRRELQSHGQSEDRMTGRKTEIQRVLDMAGPDAARNMRARFNGISSFGKMVSWNGDDSSPMTCMLHPTSSQRMVLDCIGVIILLYDMIAIPYMLAWDAQFKGFLIYGAWTAMVFWTIDMLLSFRTGVFRDGVLILDSKVVLRQYIRTWFLPDFALVAIDWITLLPMAIMEAFGETADEPSGNSPFKLLRFAKVSRMLRIISVFRMIRCIEIFQRLSDRSTSSLSDFFFEVFRILFVILWLNHVQACIWFAIGRLAKSDTGHRWLETRIAGNTEQTYKNEHMWYQYLTAYHWSMTQMTPGSMNVQPLNTTERVYNIITLVVGLLFFSTLVSSLSSRMMHFKMLKQAQANQFNSLRRFLRQKKISQKTTIAVQKQVGERMSTAKPLTVQDVSALELLSLSMKLELMFELCKPHVLRHPLFHLWSQIDSLGCQKFCVEGVHTVVLSPSDTLFMAGSTAYETYLLVLGSMMYMQDPTTSMAADFTQVRVREGSWLAEAALWCEWIHVGTAEATTIVELLALHPEAMLKIMSNHHLFKHVAREYAINYHKRVTESLPPALPWPSDLHVPCTDFIDIARGMCSEVRIFVSLIALSTQHRTDAAVWRRRTMGQSIGPLEEEVRSGACTLVLTPDGEVNRILGVTAIHLQRQVDRKVLMEVGKVGSDGEVIPRIVLPGKKQEEGQDSLEALENLLDGMLAPLALNIELGETEHELTMKESAKFSITTLYMRTIRQAFLVDSDTIPKLHKINVQQAPPYISTGTKSGTKTGESLMRFLTTHAGTGPTDAQRVSDPEIERELVLLCDSKSFVVYCWLPEEEAHDIQQDPAQLENLQRWFRSLFLKVQEAEMEIASKIYQAAIDGNRLSQMQKQ